jgi:deoxyhypusine synthase
MPNEQLQLISYKIYLDNIRSRVFNDNKAGLTDQAKLFESLVAKLYNIYYETDDFKGFPNPINPVIDLKSDKKKIVVSVKAKNNNQNKSKVKEIVSEFGKHYPDLVDYILISLKLK